MNMVNAILKLSDLSGAVTREDITRVLNLKSQNANYYIHNLKALGILINSGKKGVFLINSNRINMMSVHPYTLANLVAEPSAIAYWSALDYHGWSNRTPEIVYIQTPVRRGFKNTVMRGDMKLVKLGDFLFKPVILKPEKFFGFEKMIVNKKEITVTDREKTILDCLDKPKYAGTMEEVLAALRNAEFDKNRLLEYVRRMHNKTLIKRVGYVSETLGWGIENELLDMLTSRDKRSYPLFDPNGPNTGHFNYKWGLRINIPESYWRETEWM